MGLIRFLLALSVVLTHAGIEGLVGGRNAVQAFYMVSGFLISYVLVEKARYPTVADFYVNRWLRIYPMYAVLACLTLLAYYQLPIPEAAEYRQYAAAIAVPNLILFTQDWVFFLPDGETLQDGLLIPQAWTLGVEMSFYLIAPFVLTRRKLLLALLLCSIGVRVALFTAGVGNVDPWSYRFFPAELAVFLIGALSHQILLPRFREIFRKHKGMSEIINVGYAMALLAFPLIPAPGALKSPVLLALTALSLPALFAADQRYPWCRWLGELSFPLYLCHVLIIQVMSVTVPAASSLVVVTAAIAASVALRYIIAEPVEHLRSWVKARIERDRTAATGGLCPHDTRSPGDFTI